MPYTHYCPTQRPFSQVLRNGCGSGGYFVGKAKA
jgi:hypothetical protein